MDGHVRNAEVKALQKIISFANAGTAFNSRVLDEFDSTVLLSNVGTTA